MTDQSTATATSSATDRDDMIELAVSYLGATSYASYTRYGYTDDGVDATVWLVTDDDMADLGERLATDQRDAYSRWCSDTTAESCTAQDIVVALLPIEGDIDIAGLCVEAGAAGDYLTCAACDHLESEILRLV